MAYSVNLTESQKIEVTKLIAESDSPSDTVTAWISSHLATTLDTMMRSRLHEYIASTWMERGEKQESLKALGSSDMEAEYVKYFPTE